MSHSEKIVLADNGSVSAGGARKFVSGGLYAWIVDANFGGGGKVQLLMHTPTGNRPDTVIVPCDLTDNGVVTIYLPSGSYRYASDAPTSVYASLTRIPTR